MSSAGFNWSDPLNWQNALSDEEKMIQESAHQYAQEKLMPRVLDANRNENFDRQIMNELGEMGLLGATLP